MLYETILKKHFILASQSPRRRQLFSDFGLNYETAEIEVDETYPSHLKAHEIAVYLCKLKANSFDFSKLNTDSILVTADTIVWLNGEYIGKPQDEADARRMLQKLSGNTHSVYTGVCICSLAKQQTFYAETKVQFKNLTDEEIDFYIHHFKPFDKAGSYGIQDWMGYVGVKSIEGSFFNVMGFPMQRFYEELDQFIENK